MKKSALCGRQFSEQESHLNKIPELAAVPPDVPDAAALLDEPELAVEGDPNLVLGEYAKRELVQTMRPCRVDRGGDERGPDATPAPSSGDEHASPKPNGVGSMNRRPTGVPSATATSVSSSVHAAATVSMSTG